MEKIIQIGGGDGMAVAHEKVACIRRQAEGIIIKLEKVAVHYRFLVWFACLFLVFILNTKLNVHKVCPVGDLLFADQSPQGNLSSACRFCLPVEGFCR